MPSTVCDRKVYCYMIFNLEGYGLDRLDSVLDESFNQGNATLYFGITRRSNQKGSQTACRT
jgi:hypothetical protein